MNRSLTLEPTLFDRRLGPMVGVSLAAHVLLALALFFAPMGTSRPIGMRFLEAQLVPGVPISPVPKGVPESRERFSPPDAEDAAEDEAPSAPTPEERLVRKSDEMTLPIANPTVRQKERERLAKQTDSAIERIRKRKAKDQFGDPEGVPGTQADYGEMGMDDRILMLYLARITKAVQQNWVRPMGVPETAKVNVSIFLRIDAGGGVFDARIDRTCGYAAADRTALQALQKSAPFPPPPPSVAASIRREGVALIFFLNQ
jgi:TonB family protein